MQPKEFQSSFLRLLCIWSCICSYVLCVFGKGLFIVYRTEGFLEVAILCQNIHACDFSSHSAKKDRPARTFKKNVLPPLNDLTLWHVTAATHNAKPRGDVLIVVSNQNLRLSNYWPNGYYLVSPFEPIKICGGYEFHSKCATVSQNTTTETTSKCRSQKIRKSPKPR